MGDMAEYMIDQSIEAYALHLAGLYEQECEWCRDKEPA